MALRDKRRLGRCALEPRLRAVGPDAAEVSPRRTSAPASAAAVLPVKARIMDQAVIAGVGNLLADEALWRARLTRAGRPATCRGRARPPAQRDPGGEPLTRSRGGGVHTGKVIPARRRGGAARAAAADGARDDRRAHDVLVRREQV